MNEVLDLLGKGDILFKKSPDPNNVSLEGRMFNKFIMLKSITKKEFQIFKDHFKDYKDKADIISADIEEAQQEAKNASSYWQKFKDHVHSFHLKEKKLVDEVKDKGQSMLLKFEAESVCASPNTMVGKMLRKMLSSDPNAKGDMGDACGIMKTIANKNDPYYLNMRLYILDGINKLETLLDSLPEVKIIQDNGYVELKKKHWVPLYDLLFDPIPNDDGKDLTFFGYILWTASQNGSPTAKQNLEMIKGLSYTEKVALNAFNTSQFGFFNSKKNFVDKAIETFEQLDKERLHGRMLEIVEQDKNKNLSQGGSRRKTKRRRRTIKKRKTKRGKTKRKKDKKKKTKRKK